MVGQAVTYAVAVVAARGLGVAGFEAYAVASSAFILMVTFAPLGIEKYTLRQLPVLVERGDWAHARGLLRFGIRRTLATSLAVGAAVGTCVAWMRDLSDATRVAIVVACASLPSGALVHYGMEVLSASGREVRALALFRCAVPACTLTLFALLLALPVPPSGALAVGCWGVAWTVVLALFAREAKRALPAPLLQAQPAQARAAWSREARPFFLYRIALGLQGQMGVLALDLLQPSAAAVGAYAAALGTVGFAAVMATATNRAYARRLALMLEHRDFAAIAAMRRARLAWLLPAVAVFVAAGCAGAPQMLSLFRPEFVAEGVLPMRILTIATATTVLLAMAPTYVKYRRHHRATYTTLAIATAAQMLLLAVLVPHHAAAGAAVAYGISMCGMYSTFAWLAHRELVAIKSTGDRSAPR